MRCIASTCVLALLSACSKPADTGRASAAAPPSSKSMLIAKGTPYKETDYKVPGKIVLLDFYADW